MTVQAKGKLWVADVPKGWRFHYLYVDGQPVTRARLHDTHWRKWSCGITFTKPSHDGQAVTFQGINKAQLANVPSNGDLEMTLVMAQYGVMGNGVCGYGPGTLDGNKNNTITRNWIHDIGLGKYQFKLWEMFRIRSEDFTQEMRDGVRMTGGFKKGMFRFNRENMKPYMHRRNNLIENNIVVEPEQLLDEGGAIYAWATGKGNIWKDYLIFKASGMPGSSILALDNNSEYFTITGNVIWMEGRAACGTIGVRPDERGNVIKDNIRAASNPNTRTVAPATATASRTASTRPMRPASRWTASSKPSLPRSARPAAGSAIPRPASPARANP
ncbi:hypothetical protein OKA05_15225 [Luteolibacter arcticus]|uniref:Right handed beta helix region n=1 Tax=Luteolibacter arcticus TaxID=1581411 RepID=A0ABT3GK73_9BACT|nr:hypothetical protein [Luteolibacter arcticus]MCW1923919.1 hypothetical protein [Luteolibacter arcticus]